MLPRGGKRGRRMSYHEYIMSREIERQDLPFYALIMAAMRKADDNNIEKLKYGWPEVWTELYTRYHAPGGLLEGEQRGEGEENGET